MINKSKMKVSVFILGLMLAVGQGFAAINCATGTGWGDFFMARTIIVAMRS